MTDKRIKVLLLEDEAAHIEAIRRALESKGDAFKLQVVGSLKKYREHVSTNPPDIALLDMVLPDGNGIDLLMAPPEANAFPMLLLTSHGNEQTAVTALQKGALDYIVKSPETFVNMPRILTRALNQWSLIQGAKSVQQALQTSENNFSNSIERSPLGIRIVSEDGETLYANKAFLDIYGFNTVEEFKTTPVKDRYTPQSYIEFRKRREKRRRHEPLPENYEVSIVRKDGMVRHLEVVRKEILWGGKSQYQTIYQDITERKQAEEALKNSEERLRTTVQNAPVGIAASGSNRKFISANDEFCRILGYTESELQKLTFKDITHPEDVGESARLIQTLDAGEISSFHQEKRYVKKDGKVIIGSVTLALLRDQMGNPRMYIAELQDITEHKRAEEALIQSELRYRTLFETANEGILIADIETRKFRYANPAICKMLGYSQAELTTMSVTDIHPKDSLELVLAEFDTSGKQKKALSSGIPCLKKDGTMIDADINISRTVIEGREHNVGFFTDITERKQLEDAIKASEVSYRRLFESAKDGILIIDANTGLITDANPFLNNLLGLSLKEIKGRKLWEIGTFSDIVSSKMRFQELQQKGYVRYEDLPLKTTDGRQISVEFVSNMYDVNHHRVIQCNIHDITERKQAEEALRESEAKYRLIVENTNDIVFTFDAAGKFIYISPSVKKALGYNPSDLIGHPFSSLVHPEDLPGLQQAIQRNIKNGYQTPGGNEFRVRDASGEWHWHNASGNAVFDANGEFIHFIVIARDVSEHKQMMTQINELNDILQLVSDINQLIVETDNQAELLLKACNRLIESRQYQMAWIGFKKADSSDFLPAVWCGTGADYLSAVRITWDDSPLGQGPTSTAIKTGKPSVMRDILHNPRFDSWRVEALKHGFQSSAAMPLIIRDNVIGTLTIYSASANAFNDNELHLLSELAGDLSLGLEKIRRREEISKTQEALQASEQNFRNSIDSSFIGINIIDNDFHTLYANQVFLEIFGYENIGEVSASPPQEHYTAESHADYVLRNEKILQGEPVPDKVEVDIVRKDGVMRHLQLFRKEVLWDGKQRFQILYNDITERKQAEEALRDSDRKLREAQEIAHLGFWQWDIKTGNVQWSDEVFKIFHLDPKGFTPQIDSILALSPWPEYHQRDQELIKRATETHVPGSYEQKFLRPDNSIGYYYSDFQGEYDDSGKLVSIIGTVLDITQRKIAEEALQASSQNFRNTLDVSSMGIRIVDTDFHILYVNKAFLDIFGYKNTEEATLSPPREHYTPESYAGYLLRHESLLQGEPIPENLEIDIIRKDGTIRHLQTVYKEVFWDGKFQYQTLYTDITAQKQMEEALKTSEQNFRNSIDKSPLGIRIRDKNGNILYSNQAFLDMFGYKNIDEVKIHPPPEYYTPESHAKYLLRNEKRMRGESLPDSMEIDILRKDGDIRHLQVLRREVIWNGKPQHQVLYNDITDRKRLEEALKVSEQNFRNSLDNSFIGTYIVDTAEYIPYANQAFLDMFGYKNIEEVEASPPTKHYTPESYTDFLQRMEKESRGEVIPVKVEVDIVRKDGIIRHLQVFRREVIWDGKQQHQVLFNDITERRQIEDALKSSEQNFRNSMDAFSIGIRITNVDGYTLYANQTFLNIFGYKNMDELRTSPPQEHYTKESYGEYLQRKEQFAHGETIPDVAYIDIVRKDGNIRNLHIFNTRVLWNNKEEFQGLYYDITEHKQMEETVRNNERKLTTLFEVIPVGIFILDTEQKVVYMNPALGRIMDISKEGLFKNNYKNRKYLKADGTPLLTEELANVRAIKEQKPVYDIETSTVKEDGTVIWTNVSAIPVAFQDWKVVMVVSDITERKKAEEEKRHLEEKAQVASRLAAVGEMAAGIAHEINNPLTGVLGFSQMLLEKENVPEDIKENLKLIANGSQRVADIVKRLLTFARQAKPLKTMANLNELIENTLKLREYVLKTSSVEVVTRFDPELPWSMVDPGQLQQVFLNLIVNAEQAIKGDRGRGTLTITTKENENNIFMSFQDDGPGISRANMARLFEPFFTTKAPGEGTGLGLSLSRSIILEHNGTMNVESELGHGATFIIELPINTSVSEAEVLSSVTKAQPTATKKGKILAIDDELGVRLLLEKVLTQSGHSVETIEDADTALEKLNAGATYDVILTDVRMPGMSGIELYSHIIEKMPAMKDRIIFVTGDVMGADIKSFLTQNNLPFLAKPFNIELLKETIEHTLMAGQPEKDKPNRGDK